MSIFVGLLLFWVSGIRSANVNVSTSSKLPCTRLPSSFTLFFFHKLTAGCLQLFCASNVLLSIFYTVNMTGCYPWTVDAYWIGKIEEAFTQESINSSWESSVYGHCYLQCQTFTYHYAQLMLVMNGNRCFNAWRPHVKARQSNNLPLHILAIMSRKLNMWTQ